MKTSIAPQAVLWVRNVPVEWRAELFQSVFGIDDAQRLSEESYCDVAVRSLQVRVFFGNAFLPEFCQLRAAGLPLPVICCTIATEPAAQSVLFESPWENDLVGLCVADGCARGGIRLRGRPGCLHRQFVSAEGILGEFGTLPGTAAHWLAASGDGDKLGQALRLACGFLESRLDAVRAEMAQVLVKAHVEAEKNGLTLPYDL